LLFKKGSFFLITFLSGLLIFPQSLEIFYTASLNGNLDGCDCKAVPRAGLVRTASFIRQRDPSSLFFDLGDSFDVYPDEHLHTAIQSAYLSLHLDGAALGDQDFIEGVDWIKNSSHPYLAHNLRIDGDEVSPQFKRFSTAGIEVGVGAVIDPGVFYFSADKIKERLIIADPIATAMALLQDMDTAGIDVKVLLYHGSLERARDIMTTQTGWDIILVGHEQRLESQISADGRRFLGSPGDNGNRVGVVKITVAEGRIESLHSRFSHFSYWEDPKDPHINGILEEYRRSLLERLRR